VFGGAVGGIAVGGPGTAAPVVAPPVGGAVPPGPQYVTSSSNSRITSTMSPTMINLSLRRVGAECSAIGISLRAGESHRLKPTDALTTVGIVTDQLRHCCSRSVLGDQLSQK